MQGNRGRDTSPELRIRSLVHRLGLRFRVDTRPIQDFRRTADLVFRTARVAVFVDGCFWHGCPQHYVRPRANADFWKSKVQRNMERDKETDRVLHDDGWKVIRIWEHEDPVAAADQIAETVGVRRQRSHQSAS